jgi:uncharacterized protein
LDNLLVAALVTGLTTGGLSCLAVQGGLVTSSIAQQLEGEVRNQPQPRGKAKSTSPRGLRIARPILLFLTSKLAVHTLFGFFLGWVGSILTLSPVMRGILQFAIGLFMIGNALRILNVHPIFRYITFEPPSSITRYIRRKSKNKDASPFTPIFLGALTLLIPCGITQAMMVTAIGSGSPFLGAAILFAYVLGTSPVFFAITYLATKLGSLLEKQLMRFVAITLLILGLVSIDSGLNLTGSPVSLSTAWASLTGTGGSNPSVQPTLTVFSLTPDSPEQAQSAPTVDGSTIQINVKNNGYEPAQIVAKAGQAYRIKLVTKGVYSCSRSFTIPALDIQRLLPDTGEDWIELAPQQAGSTLRFTCSMGMYTGSIRFE